MLQLNIHEAKTHLSRHLDKVGQGESILLCKRNVPVAEIRPINAAKNREIRPIGLAKGEFTVPDSFFDDLPDDLLDALAGEGK